MTADASECRVPENLAYCCTLIFHRHQQDKKRGYPNKKCMEVENGSFTPLVFGTIQSVGSKLVLNVPGREVECSEGQGCQRDHGVVEG